MDNVLQRPVLVLNKGWHPIDTVSVERAIKMCVGEWADEHGKMHPKAEILDKRTISTTWTLHDWESWGNLVVDEGELVVRSSYRSYLVPEIIVVSRYSRVPQNQLKFNRSNLFKRDKYTCQYCGKRKPIIDLSTDHIMPKSRGGKTNWDNCCVSCYACNQRKRNRTPEEAGLPIPKTGKPGSEIIIESHIRMESWEKFLGKTRSE